MKPIIFTKDMTEQERIEMLRNAEIHNGALYSVSWDRSVKTKKAYQDKEVRKTSKGAFRMGITYSHCKAVAERGTDVQPLPASQRVDGILQYSINEYGEPYDYKVRLFTMKGKKAKTAYYLDGELADRDALYEDGIICKEGGNTSELVMFTVRLMDLTSVGVKA